MTPGEAALADLLLDTILVMLAAAAIGAAIALVIRGGRSLAALVFPHGG